MKKMIFSILFAVSVLSFTHTAHAAVLQYADLVIDFSSQWGDPSWAAHQALGAPNTGAYGDYSTSWAPRPRSGSLEFITVGFNTPVYADGVTIRETYGNGFVYRIDAIDTSDVFHQLWTGVDPSAPGVVADTFFGWARTGFLVDGLKIYTNTDTHPDHWEEIDSIQLRGYASPFTGGHPSSPEPSTFALLGIGLAGLAFRKRS